MHSQNCEERLLVALCLSVRPQEKTLLPVDRFLWKLIYKYFSKICWENYFFSNLTRITGALLKNQTSIFDHISLNSFSTEKNFKNNYRESQTTHFIFNNVFIENSMLSITRAVPVTTAWRVLRLRIEERPPIWRVIANLLNKETAAGDKLWSSSLEVGRRANTSSL